MNDQLQSIEDCLACSAEAITALRQLVKEKPSAANCEKLSMAAARHAKLLEDYEVTKRLEVLENEAGDSAQN